MRQFPTGYQLTLTPEEFGHLGHQAIQRLRALAVDKVVLGHYGCTIQFWGAEHLKLGLEVCVFSDLKLEN